MTAYNPDRLAAYRTALQRQQRRHTLLRRLQGFGAAALISGAFWSVMLLCLKLGGGI